MAATTRELDWAAGFLEGEGSFTKSGGSVVCEAVQAQREPIDRLHRVFGGNVGSRPPKNPKHQVMWKWSHCGAGVAMTLYVLMSTRRRRQIATALDIWRRVGLAPQHRKTCPSGHVHDSRDSKGARMCRRCRTIRRRILLGWTISEARSVPSRGPRHRITTLRRDDRDQIRVHGRPSVLRRYHGVGRFRNMVAQMATQERGHNG